MLRSLRTVLVMVVLLLLLVLTAALMGRMVFSCSWAVYFTDCAARYPPAQWIEQCGAIPWDDDYINDKVRARAVTACRRHEPADESRLRLQTLGCAVTCAAWLQCHMWRYGDDLKPVWGVGAKGGVHAVLSGGGGGGVGDIIEFASGIFAYNWREHTRAR